MAETISIIVNVCMFLALGIAGFVKISGHKTATARINDVEKDLGDHLADSLPHKTCSEHTVLLKNVNDTLKRFENTINTLDERVYDMVKNGGKKLQERVQHYESRSDG